MEISFMEMKSNCIMGAANLILRFPVDQRDCKSKDQRNIFCNKGILLML